MKNKVLNVATGLTSFTHFFLVLQVLDRDECNDDTSEEEQGPEVWEDVSMEDLLCDIESREPCPEPTPKQTRTQKLTTLVQWLVYFSSYVAVSMQAQ